MTSDDPRYLDGWALHRKTQLEASLATTPAQRLRWLEEAIRFAFEAGALPDRRQDTGTHGSDDPGA